MSRAPSRTPRPSPRRSPSSSPPRCAPPASAWPSPCPARASSLSSTRSRQPGSGSSPRATREPPRYTAQAYGQLTGRPAACLGTRIVGAANLAIGIHTGQGGDSAHVRARGPGRTPPSRPRGLPGIRPRRWHREPGQVGRGIEQPAHRRRHPRSRRARGARWPPGTRAHRPTPRTCCRSRSRPVPGCPSCSHTRMHRRCRTSGRFSISSRPRAACHPGRGRCSPRAVLQRPGPVRGAAPRPGVATWRRGDVVPNDHPLYIRHDRVRQPRARSGAASRPPMRMLVLGPRLSEPTGDCSTTVPAPGQHVDAR